MTSPSACEQAALKLGFVAARLDGPELEDLVNLTVNGEVQDPASGLGEHVNDCWPEIVGPADRSLVHWLRRLVFRSAWLDQRVKEGELDVVFDDETHTFGYVQPDRDAEPIELSPEPNWRRVAYRRASARARRTAATCRPSASARACGDLLRAGVADEQLRAHGARGGEVDVREAAQRR